MAKSITKHRGEKAGFPRRVEPMLATLVDEPVDQPGWLYEIKWDGYRAVALINKGKVNLLSRNNKSFNDKFYPVYQTLQSFKINAVLDGEVVVLNEKGVADFGSLQNWRSEADGQLIYYVFDILWLDGFNLEDLPLSERKEILKQNLPEGDLIRYSDSFETKASEFLAVAANMGMEGIMAKKADSPYIEGERTRDWLKIKASQRQEVVIGGFTNNEDSPKIFSSLLVGVYEKGKLHYIGKIGTGFNDKLQREIFSKMKTLITKKIPFDEEPDVNAPSRFRPNPPKAKVTWLKPKLVCEVRYAEITKDGVMRHPSFVGMRDDKPASAVKRERAMPAKKVMKKKRSTKYTRPVTDKSR